MIIKVIKALCFALLPIWPVNWLRYYKWSKGMKHARQKATQLVFYLSMSVVSIITIFADGWPMLGISALTWQAMIPLWIVVIGAANLIGQFTIPNYEELMNKEEYGWVRIPWHEGPEPNGTSFPLGTNGTRWIWYHQNRPEYEKGAWLITGPLSRGRSPNTIIAAVAPAITIILDGEPASGYNFRWLRNLDCVSIIESRDMIIKAVRWIHSLLIARVKEQNKTHLTIPFLPVLMVLDENMTSVMRPGWKKEETGAVFYAWPEVRSNIADIVRSGRNHGIYLVAMAEACEEPERFDPHFRQYIYGMDYKHAGVLDAFTCEHGEKIKGLNIQDDELAAWIEFKISQADTEMKNLWKKFRNEYPIIKLKIEEKPTMPQWTTSTNTFGEIVGLKIER